VSGTVLIDLGSTVQQMVGLCSSSWLTVSCIYHGILCAMRLYFIRHAQSANNALWDATGSEAGRSDDPELSAIGQEQAVHLARFVARQSDPLEPDGFGITHLYTSPMIRAVQTAAELGQAIDVSPRIWPDWHEAGGIWLEQDGVRVGRVGKNRTELLERFPQLHLPDEIAEAGWWSRPYETEDQLLPRAKRVWQGLLERHGNTQDRVAVISHGHFYAFVMAVALNVPIDQGRVWFAKHNTGITRLDHRENAFDSTVLVYQNRLSHLPGHLVT
jgi:2,3-bisphosphoglycerate-dependent phosphoglycerate mutase